MSNFKKGDIVSRISYKNDVLFSIEYIIKNNNVEIAILKGIDIRIKADAPVEDLQIVEKQEVKQCIKNLDERIKQRINEFLKLDRKSVHYGAILHLDGDKRYSEKSVKYYRKLGLNAIVKNIKESKQPAIIGKMILAYRPDILVITRT